jgi:predicted nucleic acid-binding protein
LLTVGTLNVIYGIGTVIAAAAAEHGGLPVLHRDAHFDRLAEVLAFENIPLPGP